jgi:spermidine/putrescine transport system permease protein
MATIATDVAAAAPPPRGRRMRAPKWGLALPAWFWFVFFFLVPVAFIVVYSFGYKPASGAKDAVGLDRLSWDNYSKVLDTSGPLYETFRQTLIIAVTGTVLCLLIAFPFAYWLAAKVPAKWKGVLLGLIIVPFWTSFLIRTIAWRIVLAPKGLIASWLQQLGAVSGPLSILDTRQAVQIGVVYNYLPLMIFPLFVTLDRLDPALREASKDLGASRWRTFTQVTLPLSMPGVVAGLLLVYIPLAGDYITASVLGGAKGNMAGALVASQFQAAQNQSLGSAMAVVLIAMIMLSIGVVAVVALFVRWAVRRIRGIEIGEGGPPLPIEATAGAAA